MLYTTRNLQINSLNEISRLLENANYLTEQECIYRPEMVPIRENLRIQKDIIRLEDFVDYALANGITEGGYALAQICEASGVSQDNIVFSVDEVSILEDSEMEDTVRQLLEKGQTVYACPISRYDIAYMLAESVTDAANICLSQGNEDYCDELLEAYINDRFDILLSEEFIVESVLDQARSKAGSWIDNAKMSARDLHDKVVNSANDAKNWAARKISSLRTVARNKLDVAEDRAGHLGDNASAFMSKSRGFVTNNANLLKSKINNGIEYLGNKLKKKKLSETSGIATSNSYGKGFDPVKANQMSRAMNTGAASSQWDTFKSGIKSIGRSLGFGKGSDSTASVGTGSGGGNQSSLGSTPNGNGKCSAPTGSGGSAFA